MNPFFIAETYLSLLLLLVETVMDNGDVEKTDTEFHERHDEHLKNKRTVPLNQSHRDTFGVNSSSEERRLPRVDVFLTLTGQLQLTVVLVHIPVDREHEYR